MNKNKKWLAAILVASMALCTVACGSAKEEKVETETQEQTTVAPEEVDIWAPYEEAVTLTTVALHHPGEVYPEGDDITSNVWTRFFEEKMNVEIDTQWVSDDYETKTNLSIAEGSIPDVFWVKAPQMAQLVEAGMVMDITELFDTYASDRLKSYMEYADDTFETGKTDGKLYGIPQLDYGYINQPNYVWIRQDWKNELGFEDPETMEDLEVMSKAFVENFGGFGIATDLDLSGLKILAPAWGAYPTIWVNTDNGIEYGGVQPEMKAALETYAKWYQEGILDSEFAISDYNKTNEAVINGKSGVQPFYQWWGYMGKDVVANLGAEATFTPYNVPTATGEEVLSPIPFTNPAYTVISKDCKNPEAVIKLMNAYVYAISEDSVGELDEETRTQMQALEFTPNAFMITNPESDYEQYVRVSEALETGDTSNLVTPGQMEKYTSSLDWIENQGYESYGDYMQQGAEQSAYGLGKEIIDNERYIFSELWGQNPESLNQMGSTLDDLLIEGYTKIIIGSESVDYFDTLVANWYQAGGEQVTQDVQAMYGAE
ncbi:MAG: extracellular solute-binding protein [Eubacteriales bacterium]